MTTALRVLFIEDNEDDLFLTLRELRKGGYDVNWTRVDTRTGMESALHDGAWDLVICDHVMPDFSSARALDVMRERGLDVPFIVVSGVAPEELVTEAMRAGAHDFISKGSLVRLVPAIERELKESVLRKERLQIASRLAESEGRYTMLFHENPAPMLLVESLTLMIVDANRAASEFFGYPLQVLTQSGIIALSTLARAGAWRIVQKARGQRSYRFSDTVQVSDGSTREIDVCAVKIQQGSRVLLLATLFDQTERKAAESALRESELRFRALADSTPMLIWTSGTDTKCNYFNHPWLAFTGRTLEQEVGEGWVEGVHPEDLQGCVGTYLGCFARRDPFEMEYRLRRHDGEFRWILDCGLPRFSESGEFMGYVGSCIDITDRKRAEEGISKLAAAVEQVADAIAIMDASGDIEYVNQAFATLTGMSVSAAQGWNLPDLLEHKDVLEAVQQARSGNSWEGRVTIRMEASQPKELDITCSPVRDGHGRITNLVAVLRDITAEAELERQIRQSHKMDALGALAAGIAHDFNNVLTTILTASQLLKANLPDESPLQSKVDAIQQAGLCAAGLTKQILSFSHKSDEKRLPLDFSSVVKSTLQMLRSTQPLNTTIQSDLSSGIWVEGDAALLNQVVLNLAINAFHAMRSSGGTLHVSLTEVAGSDLTANLGLGEGRFALLQMRDTGCGMDAATMERIFDPFFTTKPAGEGTGLGLSLVHAAVSKASGRIQVHSRVGEGTTFRIYWPCVTGRETPQAVEPIDNLRGVETFLFVDDEELVAALAKLGLQNFGYTVTTRNSSLGALEEFRNHASTYDLVFTDLAMPEMNGADLATKLQEIRPDVPVILVSGLPMAATLSLGARARFQSVVSKPFTPQDLASSARKVLQGRKGLAHGLHDSQAPNSAEGAARPRRGARVLLAEDSHTTRAMIRTWMEKAGYEIHVAQDGMEAWDLFTNGPERGRFDLLLTDVVMPRLDGLELTQLVRRTDPTLPIAILTSNEDKDTVKSALHLGVNEFLNKPFEAQELLSCVERLLATQASRMAERRSMETARAVRLAQRTMVAMPEKGMPLYSLYEPLTDAGGDVFRCMRCADGSILFILADVAGHSVLSSYAVASFLAMLSTFVGECLCLMALPASESDRPKMLHSCGLYGQIPCQPLRHLAQKLNEGIQSGPFSEIPVCTLIGQWDPASGRLQLLNAGIPHGILHCASGSVTTPIEINGTPLGIFSEPDMEEVSLRLGAGDRLLFGTDGFFDVMSPDHRPFSELVPGQWSRLGEQSIDRALSAICERVRDHGSGVISDDLLVIGFEQPAPQRASNELLLRFPSTARAIDVACDRLNECLNDPDLSERMNGSRRFDIVTAVREALTNAVFHGNGNRPEAFVTLHCRPEVAPRRLSVSVRDEGPGFDLETHSPPLDPLSERGRGIPLIRAYAQDMHMNGGELTMTFLLEETPHDQRQVPALS